MSEPRVIDPADTSLAIVIVSYNTRENTLACLDSITLGDAPTPPRVIVVDNGSVDGSAEAIRVAHPQVTVIEAGDNVGFARGVNRGVAVSEERFVLLLNPDTLLLEGSLRALIEFAVANPRYGVYGGRTLRPDGSVDPSSCWGAPSMWSLVSFATMLSTAFRGNPLLDPESLGRWQRDSVREVPIVTGCLLLIERAEYERVGRLDERFFLYGEDAEFSIRARRSGLRPVIVPSAVIVHDVGASTRDAATEGNSGRKMCMVMAGKATMLRLSWSPASARMGIALLQAGALVRAGLEAATRRERRAWTEVWQRRRDWRVGYPEAERTLFGRVPGTGASR
ncbi:MULTISPECIES: glycosyltransferase family 2 protein [unclassified Rathayibacter]|uniref:glycosyltransferase family 2 protein n=1 Tax=unclassified Rathayibacter TaxID=2609250 RepID=UPI00188CCBA4|nr:MULTISPECIES: glycosyltransferase family 2 protein [unclassified Rathayibacter]MBF4461268.1 glycosyltransferase family 2 protein [Rathayibacter sp. VKM Ac-2879]MBF4502679.1 glycosyltransferase family 2 protein [Rathayibacter sp. VKM Ac-2878]